MLSLLKHEIGSRWTGILGWGFGLSIFAAIYIATYSQFVDTLDSDMLQALNDMPMYEAMGMSIATFEGYVASSVVLFIPIILSIYAIMASTGTLAGEDDSGALELIVTMPLKRRQIIAMKAAALAIVTLIILIISGLGGAIFLTAMKSGLETDLTGVQLFTAIVNAWPLTLAYLMMGLFFSAWAPNRRTAATVTTVLFIAGYFGENLLGLVESLKRYRPLSPFYYFDSTETVFFEGVKASDVGILLGVAACFFVLALIGFERRDITVGRWPWVRGVRPGSESDEKPRDPLDKPE